MGPHLGQIQGDTDKNQIYMLRSKAQQIKEDQAYIIYCLLGAQQVAVQWLKQIYYNPHKRHKR